MLGRERAELLMGKERVGRVQAGEPQRLKATSINYKDVEFEFKIRGSPPGRRNLLERIWTQSRVRDANALNCPNVSRVITVSPVCTQK